MPEWRPIQSALETGPSTAGATRVGGPVSAADRCKRDKTNFVRLGRSLEADYRFGRLTFDEYGLLVLAWQRANHHDGVLSVSYVALAEESRGKFNKNKINKIFLNLKAKDYIWFDKAPGRRGPAPVVLNYYPLARGGFTDLSRTFETGVRVRSMDDVVKTAQSPTAIHQKAAEVSAEGSLAAQRFLQDDEPVPTTSFDALGEGSSRGTYNEKEKKKKWENDKSIPLRKKPKYDPTRPNPSSLEEQQAREIADALGEADYRFVTSALSKYGINVLELAYWKTMEEYNKGGVTSKGALFNALTNKFGGARIDDTSAPDVP